MLCEDKEEGVGTTIGRRQVWIALACYVSAVYEKLNMADHDGDEGDEDVDRLLNTGFVQHDSLVPSSWDDGSRIFC
jgi:hypothetical protein